MNNPMSLDGRVVVITGAAQGIGRGVAQAAAALGATLVLVDLNGDDQLDIVVAMRGTNAGPFPGYLHIFHGTGSLDLAPAREVPLPPELDGTNATIQNVLCVPGAAGRPGACALTMLFRTELFLVTGGPGGEGVQRCGGCRSPVRIQIGNHHVRAFAHEAFGDGPADAPRGPRHHGGLVLKFHVVFPFRGAAMAPPLSARGRTLGDPAAGIQSTLMICAAAPRGWQRTDGPVFTARDGFHPSCGTSCGTTTSRRSPPARG